MDTIQVIILALLQGLTEFLPISSSAHLILLPHWVDWPDQGVAFDVAVHVGTLLAVLTYFRQQLLTLWQHAWSACRYGHATAESRLVWGVMVGTLPVGMAGFLLVSFDLTDNLRNPLIIAVTTLVFGLLLGLADLKGERNRNEYQMRWRDIILIGLAQALALIPGTSRSGITMTAALFLGLQRQAAARFSFLLSIPVIILAGADEIVLLSQTEVVNWSALFLGLIISATSAYLCIHFFIQLLDRIGMWPFVIYRLILGGGLLFFYGL